MIIFCIYAAIHEERLNRSKIFQDIADLFIRLMEPRHDAGKVSMALRALFILRVFSRSGHGEYFVSSASYSLY